MTKPMFGSPFGAARIDSARVKLIPKKFDYFK